MSIWCQFGFRFQIILTPASDRILIDADSQALTVSLTASIMNFALPEREKFKFRFKKVSLQKDVENL